MSRTTVTSFAKQQRSHKPRTSIVWEFFQWSREGESREVFCELCGFITIVDVSSSTSKMLMHIRSHHSEDLCFLKDVLAPLPNILSDSKQEGANHFPGVQGKLKTEPDDDASESFEPSSSHSRRNYPPGPKPKLKKAKRILPTKAAKKANLQPQVILHDVLNVPKPSVTRSRRCRYTRRKSPRSTYYNTRGAEERKLNAASSAGGSLAPGFDENSAGSGDVATGCDEVSVPLSPEQFLSEDMDHASPATPSSQRPESYKLRHNNHLTLVLESLAGDESFMDVTLTAQGKSIKAHKSVLSAVSPYFRGVLKQNPCQHPIIIMPRDMKFDELSNIISYIYKGEMTVAAEDLSSLLKTAEVLQVTGLSPSEGSSGPSSIISQMQGLPTGVFPSTSTKPSKNVAKKHSKSTAHHSQPPIEESFRASPASQVQTKVDPNEFLAADMTCVKEEIQSENEDAVDATFLPIETVETEPNPPDSRELSSNIVQVMDSPSQSLDDPTGNIQEHTNDDYPQDPLETSPSPSPTPYVCPHCLETHRPQDVLHSHLRLKHPSKPSFICSCGKVFVRHSIFIDHRKGCAF